jgi:hypothetical protein
MTRFSFQAATAPGLSLGVPRPLAPSAPMTATCPIAHPAKSKKGKVLPSGLTPSAIQLQMGSGYHS